VHAKDFFIHQRCNWQAVEDIRKDLPEFDGVTTFTFIIKAINSVDLGAFVIASEQEKVLRIFDLVAEKKRHSLN